MPEEICFATKPQLAAAMLARARHLGIRARWFAGDEVYGNRELRRTAHAPGFDHTLAVRADHTATTPAGHFTATALAAQVPATSWTRTRTGHGLKGDRHYDWALIENRPDDTPTGHDDSGHAFLVMRRHRYTRELSSYPCHSATPVSPAGLVHAIRTRWKTQECLQGTKSLAGLDQGQVTRWNSWMRWSLISLIAAAILALTLTTDTADAELVPASTRELLAALRVTALPAPRRDPDHILH